MNRLKKSYRTWVPEGQAGPSSIALKMASSLIGHSVDVIANANSIAHGIVTGVLTEAGRPKLVVAGVPYDMNQLLTATPASF